MAETLADAYMALHSGNTELTLQIIHPLAQRLYESGESRAKQAGELRYELSSDLQQEILIAVNAIKDEIIPASESHVVPYTVCASALCELGQHSASLEWLDRALAWNPTLLSVYCDKARNYVAMGQYEQAQEAIEAAYPYLCSASDVGHWFCEKAAISVLQGDYKLAVAEYVIGTIYGDKQVAEMGFAAIKDTCADLLPMPVQEAAAALQAASLPLGPTKKAVDVMTKLMNEAYDAKDFDTAEYLAFQLWTISGDAAAGGVLESVKMMREQGLNK